MLPNQSIMSNHLMYGFWVGSTLLYSTKSHVYYTTVKGRQQLLFSLDSAEKQNVLVHTFIDRMLIGSKTHYITNKKLQPIPLDV